MVSEKRVQKNIQLYFSWKTSKFSILQIKYLVSRKQWGFVQILDSILHYLISIIKLLKVN